MNKASDALFVVKGNTDFIPARMDYSTEEHAHQRGNSSLFGGA
jgi:uncharacterized LabA/DUF88 family protein